MRPQAKLTSYPFGAFLVMAVLLAVALTAVTIVAPPVATAEEFTRQVTVEADKLVLANLIGRVEIVPADGDEFTIEVRVKGKDASPELIEVVVKEGRTAGVVIEFPIKEHSKYVYPELGNSKTTFTIGNGGSWLDKIWGGSGHRKIEVRGKGSGLEVWADVTVAVPRQKEAVIKQRVGSVTADKVHGDLVIDTGAGSVTTREVTGDMVIDTGSGSVHAENTVGELSVDTGSGAVVVEGFEGDKLHIDTGSGSVKARKIECDILNVDTGSGGVEVANARAQRAKIDTGSGSVKVQLDRMGDGRFVLDTGSGSVDLTLPPDASANVLADTGSGRIHVQIDDVEYETKSRDRVEFTVGNGDARVIVDTGSGSITISQR